MINPSLNAKDLWNLNKEWAINVLENIFKNPIVIEDICKMYIPKFTSKDEKVWPFSKNGNLTTKSAYRAISNNIENDSTPSINWKALWRLSLPKEF